ncbi:hypothetical protein MKX03_026851 [Papaver bracteatum]|nr:hypothetical protein MKX03_026851 [Papaver bracteatum]
MTHTSSTIGNISSSSKFTWRIQNFRMLDFADGYKSQVFSVGSYQWRLWIRPKGSHKVYDQFSLFLVPQDLTRTPYAEYTFVITSQTNRKNNVKKVGKHQFKSTEPSWGWSSFIELTKFYHPANGYLLNDTCIIEVEISSKEGA